LQQQSLAITYVQRSNLLAANALPLLNARYAAMQYFCRPLRWRQIPDRVDEKDLILACEFP